MTLPWQPLLSTMRSGQPELTFYGTLAIYHGATPVLAVGDVNTPVWSRSLLKPWQLLACLPMLRQAYPQLRLEHFALMMASHNGEPQHLVLLHELLALGGIAENQLQCPACPPMGNPGSETLPSCLYHPCSGKHVSQLLTLKAQGSDLTSYLSPESPSYQAMLELLQRFIPTRLPELAPTVDGCGMANMALTTDILAQLYRQFATTRPDPDLAVLQQAMQAHPEILGGNGRLDTLLIQRTWTGWDGPRLYAKEGADGLLGLGITPTDRYPEGLGLCLKLASGYNSEHLQTITLSVLAQLGFLTESQAPLPDPLSRQIHFTLPAPMEAV